VKKIIGWFLFALSIPYTVAFIIIMVQGGLLSGVGAFIQIWIVAAGPITAWTGWKLAHPKKEVKGDTN